MEEIRYTLFENSFLQKNMRRRRSFQISDSNFIKAEKSREKAKNLITVLLILIHFFWIKHWRVFLENFM